MTPTATTTREVDQLVEVATALGLSDEIDGGEVDRVAWLLDAGTPIEPLLEAASARRDAITGKTVSYSPKVFIDLTRLCRDRCRYCAFIRMPISARVSGGQISTEPQPYLEADEVLSIATAGAAAGCSEALFTLGDRPEDRYESARRWLRQRGFSSTAEYLVATARLVVGQTGLLPHMNPGVMTAEEIAEYRKVSVSAGLMLESTSRRLFEDPDGCHYGSPDKDPEVRIESIAEAGRQKVPFTTGILIGIGETLRDRVESLLAISALAVEHGHIQEVIVQNFRAKTTIPMRHSAEPGLDQMLRAVALARLLLPEGTAVQAPPNLTPDAYQHLLKAGLSDWGGISPVTPDHVNPEAPWPEIMDLAAKCSAEGFDLRPRLPIYPAYTSEPGWVAGEMRDAVRAISGPDGWARGAGRA